MLLHGFLHRGGIEYWSYAIAADSVTAGADFVRFTSPDVDFKTRTIMGEVWQNGKWTKKRTLFPAAIRNFELNKGQDKILDILPYSLGQIVKKDDQLALFSRTPSIAKYIPQSLNVDSNCPIIEKIKEWGAGLLKPARGRLGQGIVFLKVNGALFDINDDHNVKTVDEAELKKYLKPYVSPDAKPFILQQFAAGTGPKNRYFNIRVVLTKSGDGDWHPCNFLMSLLAKEGSIIANRDVGAKNIDLDSWLKHQYGKNAEKIYDNFFAAAVEITRILDDSKDATAEEIALDMAIDNNGEIWLHEANWRGGMWLFDDDIGLYRHGGENLNKIALQSRAGNNLERANAVQIAIDAREDLQEYNKQKKNCEIDDGVTFGIELTGRSHESVALVTEALSYALPALCISSATSFHAAQRIAKYGIQAITEQIPKATLPWVISKGGACVHDPKDDRAYQTWLDEELLKTDYVDLQDLKCGYSVSASFLNRVINENRKDLNLEKLDLFLIEGLEHSLANRENWEAKWRDAAFEMSQSIKYNLISEWGFSLSTDTLSKHHYTNPTYLLSLIDGKMISSPSFFNIVITNNFNLNDIHLLTNELEKLPLKIIFSLAQKQIVKKEWNEPHKQVPVELIKAFKLQAKKGSIILCPVKTTHDVLETLKLIASSDKIDRAQLFSTFGNPWFYNTHDYPHYLGAISMRNKSIQTNEEQLKFKKRMQVLATMAKFDHRQFFRFFVDGRFQERYKGWSGYEANEQGSVSGVLQAYCHVMDNFDISSGLQPSYIRNLHALCMKNVLTRNPKSAPGDMRYLEAGFNIFTHYSTIESIQEIIDRHVNEGTPLFHTRGFEKTADKFTAQGVFDSLKEKKRLKFRPWYPILTNEQKNALNDSGDLDAFYEVKHFIQRGFANRIDKIIHEYNAEIQKVSDDEETLIAISRVVRNLEMLHPFPDGNGRAFVAVLMNHLLMFHGFLPAILFDPNIDIELSVKEFAQEMKRGIENTKLLLDNPDTVLYNYSITQSSKDEIKKFEELAKDLIIRLSPYADLNLDSQQIQPHGLKATYLYMTPKRVAQISKGSWINANENTISNLRFANIEIDENNSSNQLFFFRNISEFKSDPNKHIKKLSENGVIAVVVDDLSVAKNSPLPALYVNNIDDALSDIGRAAKNEINCKAVSVLGSSEKSFTKFAIAHILKNQAQVHVKKLANNKTPHIMTSLANLRLTDNLEVNAIAIDNRPNPARYRSKAVAPNICLVTNFSKDKSLIESYAAIADGIKDGGLYLINSNCEYLDELIEAIIERKEVAIQTFGFSDDDMAKVLESTFHKEKSEWDVKVDILGNLLEYKIQGSDSHLPALTAGILLAVANLGYDIQEAAKEFISFHPLSRA